MNSQVEDDSLEQTSPVPIQEIQEGKGLSGIVLIPNSPPKIPKQEIRKSLRSLTLESIFATVFYSIINGALLSNFLLELGAGAVEIGLLASVPQVTNLLQPLGAYFADRMNSRHWFSLCIFGTSRLLWLLLVPAIWLLHSSAISGNQLVQLTLAVIWITNILEALGRAPFASWAAALVPERLRGRYFGLRNSGISLTNLIAVPLLGLTVSRWPGGTLTGFGVVLVLGIVFGILSLIFQFFMTDVNPQLLHGADSDTAQQSPGGKVVSFFKDTNFLKFLFYSGAWSFAVNLSAPFFNLYLLDDLNIDISVVTIYNSLAAGANLLMLVLWGRLADRIGNRPLLIIVGVFVALTPVLWLEAGTTPIFLWGWLPFLHLLTGATWAAIDLSSGNLLIAVSPIRNQSTYFAIAAAVPGITGAMGITSGSFLATLSGAGGLPALFALSAILRLAAIVPLVFVQEKRSVPLGRLVRVLFPARQPKMVIEAGGVGSLPDDNVKDS